MAATPTPRLPGLNFVSPGLAAYAEQMGALPDDYFEKCLGGIRHAALARANLVASTITRLICTLTGQLDEALLVLSGACVSHSASPRVGQ